MSDEFWIDEGGAVSGPIPRETLEARIYAGAIQPDTWISKDSKNFSPASDFYQRRAFGKPLSESAVVRIQAMRESAPQTSVANPEKREQPQMQDVPEEPSQAAVQILPDSKADLLSDIALVCPFICSVWMWSFSFCCGVLILDLIVMALFLANTLGTAILICLSIRHEGSRYGKQGPSSWFASMTLFWPLAFPVYYYCRTRKRVEFLSRFVACLFATLILILTVQSIHSIASKERDRLEILLKR